MKRDERQIRTTNKQGLLGYRADYHGKRVLAIMKGTEGKSWQCLGTLSLDEFTQLLNTGPCIDLDDIKNQ